MKKFALSLVCLLAISASLLGQNIVGFWKTVDENTKKPQSVVAVYEYQGKYYGRLILTYNSDGSVNDTIYSPRERAPGVIGEPYYAGLDIIWDLQPDGKKFTGGEIMDPEKGRIYGAELWVDEKGNLVVRGKVLFLGRNQTWPKALENDFPQGFKMPNLNELTPVIPKVKG